MFGISDQNILESADEPVVRSDDVDVIATLSYNQTHARLIRDGVDGIRIIDESDEGKEQYRVDYSGYLLGSLLVTRDGLRELGNSLLDSDVEVPYWILSLGEGYDEVPWWVPEDYELNQTIECTQCGSVIGVNEVVTTGDREEVNEYFCRDCWEQEYR
ncbi:hypothetical protein [Salinilacihabitans rarus]|uniref:hypothetical protein n=1 Tax=Salinilacihabitans rarus TaxID=2961596 RepID=UPI0020C8F020|nr:hypothetical protein [Salinilacihabitans rarus]